MLWVLSFRYPYLGPSSTLFIDQTAALIGVKSRIRIFIMCGLHIRTYLHMVWASYGCTYVYVHSLVRLQSQFLVCCLKRIAHLTWYVCWMWEWWEWHQAAILLATNVHDWISTASIEYIHSNICLSVCLSVCVVCLCVRCLWCELVSGADLLLVIVLWCEGLFIYGVHCIVSLHRSIAHNSTCGCDVAHAK